MEIVKKYYLDRMCLLRAWWSVFDVIIDVAFKLLQNCTFKIVNSLNPNPDKFDKLCRKIMIWSLDNVFRLLSFMSIFVQTEFNLCQTMPTSYLMRQCTVLVLLAVSCSLWDEKINMAMFVGKHFKYSIRRRKFFVLNW